MAFGFTLLGGFAQQERLKNTSTYKQMRILFCFQFVFMFLVIRRTAAEIHRHPRRSTLRENMVIQIRVIGPAKKEILLDVCENQEQMKKVTVAEVKKKIIDKLSIGQDSDLRLMFTTETLQDSWLLSSYGVQHMSIVHTLLLLPGGQQIKVILPTGSEKVLDLCDSQEQMTKMTVMDVKRKMDERLGTGTDLRLVFGAQTLEDPQPLSFYKIKHMSTIRTLPRVAGGTW